MKLDARNVRHLGSDDWRVLTAVEQGSRNHQIVPTSLIASIASLSTGRSHVPRHISTLAKLGLIAKVRNARYDGYRLTYGGLDYLALHAHSRADVLSGVGERVGVGKEADVMIVSSPSQSQAEDGTIERVMKMHRLGRISFRSVKNNRDYLRKRTVGSGSWMYLSKLAAQKEFAVLKALWDVGFEVPQPVACNRHTVVMERIDGIPLRQVSEVPDPASLYDKLIDMILRLASFGLIHGDFNEFNILITEVEVKSNSTSEAKDKEESKIMLRPIVIDFPQTVSTSHANASEYFTRDVDCIKRFFSRRFNYNVDSNGPTLSDVVKDPEGRRLDVEVEASGFTKKMAAELEGYLKEASLNDAEGEGETAEYELEQSQEDIEYPSDNDRDLEFDHPESGNEEPDFKAEEAPASDLKKLSLADRFNDTASVAGSVRSRRNAPNPAKVASGWAI